MIHSGRWCRIPERFARPLVIVVVPEPIQRALRVGEGAYARAQSVAQQLGAVIVVGRIGLEVLRLYPELNPPDARESSQLNRIFEAAV